jgi:hypothetical protein
MSAKNVKNMRTPKPIFIATPADFTRFEECLKSLAEKYLSPTWEWTYKVYGKVHREIQEKDPQDPGLQVIKEENKEKKHDLFEFLTPKKERNEGSDQKHAGSGRVRASTVSRSGRVPPPPPPPTPPVSKVVADVLGKRQWQVAKLTDGEDSFFKADTNTFEERELLGVRKEIWEWMVLSIEGEHKTLFCAHLVRECDKWDIQQLYKEVRDFLHTENYREYGERMEKFFTARPKADEDIFTFMSRMDKYEEEIGHLQFLAEEAGETLKMPKFCRVWKILSAVEKYPEYRVFTDRVQQLAPKEWITLSVEGIRQALHKIHSNKVSLSLEKKDKHTSFFSAQPPSPRSAPPPSQSRSPPPPPPRAQSRPSGASGTRGGSQGMRHAVRARPFTPAHPRASTPAQRSSRSPNTRHTIDDKLKHYNCPEGECLGFFRSGKCPRKELGKPCVFKHTQASGDAGANARSRSMSPVYPARGVHTQGVRGSGGASAECVRCGRNHDVSVCTWSKQCFECGGIHTARMCSRQQTRTTHFGGPNSGRRNSI